jgi:hypothetical protein
MHTFASQLKEESFTTIGHKVLDILIQISHNLPCPECAQHAKLFWSKIEKQNIKSKTDLINALYVFHNVVNSRKKYKAFKYVDLQYYTTTNILTTFNLFSRNYNTYGNLNLIIDSFHRNRLLSYIRKFLTNNISHFNLLKN